jgi:pimeloyl-ACP methyl ester carboxylesterase
MSYADVNGIKLNYETHGTGRRLHLKLERPDLMGFSLGGGVALLTAIRHPELVGKLVAVSTAIKRDAFYPDVLAQQGQVTAAAAEAMKKDFDMSKEVAKLTRPR